MSFDYNDRLLGDCPCCGARNTGGRRCRSCRGRERSDDDGHPGDEPWKPVGGSYRNVAWAPNWQASGR